MSHAKLKELNGRRKALEAKLASRKDELRILNREINQTITYIKDVDNQIKALTTEEKPIIVTEHAILRYLERVQGLDLEGVKKKILPDSMLKYAKQLGAGYYPIEESDPTGGSKKFRIRIKDNAVVTVLTKD